MALALTFTLYKTFTYTGIINVYGMVYTFVIPSEAIRQSVGLQPSLGGRLADRAQSDCFDLGSDLETFDLLKKIKNLKTTLESAL